MKLKLVISLRLLFLMLSISSVVQNRLLDNHGTGLQERISYFGKMERAIVWSGSSILD